MTQPCPLHPRCRAHRGVMLLEMLAVIILLTAFALVSAKLFTSLMHHIRDTTATRDAAIHFDVALARLRADVWSAEQLQSDSATLILSTSDRSITWQASADMLTRTETGGPSSAATQRWNAPSTTFSFMTQPQVVILRITPKTAPPDEVSLLSEAAFLKGDNRP